MRLYYRRGDTVWNTKSGDGADTRTRMCLCIVRRDNSRRDRICRNPRTRRWFDKQYTRHMRQTWLATHGENERIIRYTKPAKNNLKLGASAGPYIPQPPPLPTYSPLPPNRRRILFSISHFAPTPTRRSRVSLFLPRPTLTRRRFFRISMPALFAEYTTPTNKFWIFSVSPRTYFPFFSRLLNDFRKNRIVLIVFQIPIRSSNA